MARRRSLKRAVTVVGMVISLVCCLAFGALAQDAADRDAAIEKAVEAAVEKELREIKPPSLKIPDPPPHEGAMITQPYVVEPPDFIFVEVLEALIARPITGTRLVRPDGTITLGYYGDVYVRGLTLPQIKTKITAHLRQFIADEALGLIAQDPTAPTPSPPVGTEPELPPSPLSEPPKPDVPGLPRPQGLAPQTRPQARTGLASAAPRAKARPQVPAGRAAAPRVESGRALRQPHGAGQTNERHGMFKRLAWQAEHGSRAATAQREPSSPQAETSSTIALPANASVKITIEIIPANAGSKAEPINKPAPPDPTAKPGPQDEVTQAKLQEQPQPPSLEPGLVVVPPSESDRVYIDMESYNSKFYTILGDVVEPGRYPCTGSDTVLDAFSFAGGFLNTADQKNVILVRPGADDEPAREYKIDWAAITGRGDKRANLQIFPGDRLIVGRDKVVAATVQLNRLAEPLSLITSQIQGYSNAMRALNSVNQPLLATDFGPPAANRAEARRREQAARSREPLTPVEREAFLKDWIDFWWRAASSGGVTMDEETFKEALIRQLDPSRLQAGSGKK
jgi:protein involved in polysaccharide export with SLBB domain